MKLTKLQASADQFVAEAQLQQMPEMMMMILFVLLQHFVNSLNTHKGNEKNDAVRTALLYYLSLMKGK